MALAYKRLFTAMVWLAVLYAWKVAAAAQLSEGWKYVQEAAVSKTGLIKFSIPVTTLDVARSNLADLRIFDPEGKEVPYWLEQAAPEQDETINVKSFQVSLDSSSTIIQVETGTLRAIDGVIFETSSSSFIKPVNVEGSEDRTKWKMIAQAEPIYRQPDGSSRLLISFPARTSHFLRLTVDDARSQPIAVTGIRLHAVRAVFPEEEVAVKMIERSESPGRTRLVLDFGAKNLNLAAIQIETPEPLFTRHVTAAIQQLSENEIREQTILSGTISRVNADTNAAANLNLPAGVKIPARRILLLIQNQDSPPLAITAVHAQRRQAFAVFVAKLDGTYSILTGNPQCTAPNYDLTALGPALTDASLITPVIARVAKNPAYRQAEALPEIQNTGTPLDVSPWKYRKKVKVAVQGVQEVEPDLETLAHSNPDLRDLRLIHDGKQIPYVLERTSITKYVVPAVAEANDPKKPSLTRWKLTLPHRSLPVIGLSCTPLTAVFKRNTLVYEMVTDDRGNEVRRSLGEAEWIQTPDMKQTTLVVSISPPSTDILFLEINNSDNPPVRLENFRFFYNISHILTKTASGIEPFLYYGNQNADSPQYDIGLVGPQLLAAERSVASLGAEEVLKEPSLHEKYVGSRTSNILFWTALSLAVLVLFLIISRLLPKNPQQTP